MDLATATKPTFDPASFRDPEGQVFEYRGRIYRALSGAARERLERYADAGHLAALADTDLLVPSRFAATRDVGLDPAQFGDQVIAHDRLAMVTYPYEWSFEMLRQAALVTLDLLDWCLDRALILKDATAYNAALHNGRMTFIDILSIDDYREGQLWDGYAQFCRELLFPLMLTAYKDVDFQTWFRGSMAGIEARELAGFMTLRDRLRPGVLKHAILQSWLDRHYAKEDVSVKAMARDAALPIEAIKSNVKGLRKVIAGMTNRASNSVWKDYTDTHSYTEAEQDTKVRFVTASLDRAAPRQVIDLGANTGHYSRIAAQYADLVIAAEADPACVDVIFKSLSDSPEGARIVPLVADITNPSPALGWRLKERRALPERLSTDFFLALALVHHLCIARNIPLDQFVESLLACGRAGVVEWVDKSDAMVMRMLRNRTDVFEDYSRETFEALLERHFRIAAREETHDGKRCLYHVTAFAADPGHHDA